MSLKDAEAEYERQYLNFHKVEATIDAIEQFPDRAAELRADARYNAAEQKLNQAIDLLHAAGGMTHEERRLSAKPSGRFAIRSQGDRFGLGESWEVYEKYNDAFIVAFNSVEKAQAYLDRGDTEWHRRKEITRTARAGKGGKPMSAGATITTRKGVITSIRVVWQDSDGRDVYSWATEHNEPAYVWESVEAAQAWMDGVWRSDPQEKAKSGWEVKAA